MSKYHRNYYDYKYENEVYNTIKTCQNCPYYKNNLYCDKLGTKIYLYNCGEEFSDMYNNYNKYYIEKNNNIIGNRLKAIHRKRRKNMWKYKNKLKKEYKNDIRPIWCNTYIKEIKNIDGEVISYKEKCGNTDYIRYIKRHANKLARKNNDIKSGSMYKKNRNFDLRYLLW